MITTHSIDAVKPDKSAVFKKNIYIKPASMVTTRNQKEMPHCSLASSLPGFPAYLTMDYIVAQRPVKFRRELQVFFKGFSTLIGASVMIILSQKSRVRHFY